MPDRRKVTTRARAGLGVVLLATVAATIAVGCAPSQPRTAGTRINVTTRDFRIHMSRRSVPAGTVTFHVTNDGPSTHEFNVDRTRYRSGGIPRQADGLTANEEASGLRRIGSIEQIDLHHTGDLTVALKPGHYILWCNLEGHYLGGMHRTFEVR